QFDTHVRGSFEGEASVLADGTPQLKLAGDGKMELLGAAIEGALDFQCSPQRTRIAAAGALAWLGRHWLDARIVIDTKQGIDISGRVSVALDLTPSKLPANIEIAH